MQKKKILVLFLALIIFGSLAYYTYILDIKLKNTQVNLLEKSGKIIELDTALASSTHENQDLSDALYSTQEENQTLNLTVQQLSSEVGTLVKLTKTDPELLKKYSKVYFLNENYTPSTLVAIPSQNLSDPKRKMEILESVWPFLEKMLAASKTDGVDLKIVSAYRSFGQQSNLKANYLVTYGLGANKFSADQGYSEHQLGTTVDFSTGILSGQLSGFEKTPAYTWLKENAHKFGFVISYPNENKYYIFEPWHWRFVGIQLASTLHDTGKYFYDLDQRTIDQYLITIFDTE